MPCGPLVIRQQAPGSTIRPTSAAPGRSPRPTLIATCLLSNSGWRHFVAWIGSMPANRENFKYLLKRGSVAVIVGGARCIFALRLSLRIVWLLCAHVLATMLPDCMAAVTLNGGSTLQFTVLKQLLLTPPSALECSQ